MSEEPILIAPLSVEAFAPFGDILEANGAPTKIINQGFCGRYHDLAALDFLPSDGEAGQAGISLFDAQPRSLPYCLDMVERHPLGSQAFLPMSMHGFLVIVAPDEGEDRAGLWLSKQSPDKASIFTAMSGMGC